MRRAPLVSRLALAAALFGLPAGQGWAAAPVAQAGAGAASKLPVLKLPVLKLQVQLNSANIKVSDLWGNAGAAGDTVIGPAPPPGRSITVESAQLAYIAHLYNVDWQPVSGVERAQIERVGRPLTREELSAPIKASLVAGGASGSVSVEISDFAPPQIPPMGFPNITVVAMSYDPSGQRFNAELEVGADGMAVQRMRLSGKVQQMVASVITTRRLQPSDVIGAADVRLAQVPQRSLPGQPVDSLDLVIGQSPKRVLVSGQPLSAGDIGAPVMVNKGDTVVIVVDTPNMYMAAQGLALGAGGRGDVVQVMNPLSRAIVAARITAPGKATIAPGASPVTPARNGPQNVADVAN